MRLGTRKSTCMPRTTRATRTTLPLQITNLAEVIAKAALDDRSGPDVTAKHRCVAMALAMVLLCEEAGVPVDGAILFAKELAQRARS